MPKVSFVVAVYGVEDYIEACVRSLYGQTLEDIEIVLVDDCTLDKSIEIALRVLEEYPHRKSQVKVVRHEKNFGAMNVRRNGIKEAEGEYIINIDGDDYVELKMAELMYEKATEMDADIVLCGFWWHQESEFRYKMPVPMSVIHDSEAIKDATLDRKGWPNVWCRMVRRELFDREEMIWPVADHPEDLVITIAVTYLAQKLACIEEPLYHYCYNPRSMTNNSELDSMLRKRDNFIQNIDLLDRFYERHGIDRKYQHGIMINKVFVKNETLLFPQWRVRCRMWRTTFPKLNRVMLFGNEDYCSSYREKVWAIALLLGLYPRFKRLLLSKWLRPAAIWQTGLRKN